MNTFSTHLHKTNFRNVVQKLDKYKTTVNSPYIMHQYKLMGCVVTIYKTYKLLIQGSNVEKVIPFLELESSLENQNIAPIKTFDSYIGCDEVGVGDYFGGLVVCAVYVSPTTAEQLKQIGVCDSKKLSDREMVIMFDSIRQIVEYVVVEVLPSEYNDLNRRLNNTHAIKTVLHNTAIKQLREDLNDNSVPVVMDQYVNERKYYKYLEKANIAAEKVDLFATHAEDKYIGVAAASILARVNFLNQIKNMEEKLGFEIQLGSSSPLVVSQAKEIPFEKLGNFCKIDFSLTQKVRS